MKGHASDEMTVCILRDVVQQGWSNLLLGGSPVRLIIMVKSLKQE